MDAYNANPTSMTAALNSFNKLNESPKGVILGDMFELGETSLQEHQKIVDTIKTMNFSLVILAGSMFYKCSCPDNFIVFENGSMLKEYLASNPLKNYFILIKGSRGMKLETVVEEL